MGVFNDPCWEWELPWPYKYRETAHRHLTELLRASSSTSSSSSLSLSQPSNSPIQGHYTMPPASVSCHRRIACASEHHQDPAGRTHSANSTPRSGLPRSARPSETGVVVGAIKYWRHSHHGPFNLDGTRGPDPRLATNTLDINMKHLEMAPSYSMRLLRT